MISSERFNTILTKFKSIEPILVLGDVGVDKYTYGSVSRISPEAPVPVLEVSREWHKLGLAANVSDNLQSLEVKSTLCGVIGEDNNGSQLEHLLEEAGLTTWGMVRSPGRMTTFKERVVTETQQICRVDYETKDELDESTNQRLVERLKEFSQNHSAIILEDYGKGLFSESLISEVISVFKAQKKMIAVDPSRTTPPLWYKGVDLLKPNRVEATMMAQTLGLTKAKNVEDIAKILVDKLDLKKLVITLGGDGMAMIDTELDGKFHVIPTVANEVFDVSGAGDTAISAICSSLVSGASLQEASWIGNCASGVVVGKKGTARVNQEELKTFFEKLSTKLK